MAARDDPGPMGGYIRNTPISFDLLTGQKIPLDAGANLGHSFDLSNSYVVDFNPGKTAIPSYKEPKTLDDSTITSTSSPSSIDAALSRLTLITSQELAPSDKATHTVAQFTENASAATTNSEPDGLELTSTFNSNLFEFDLDPALAEQDINTASHLGSSTAPHMQGALKDLIASDDGIQVALEFPADTFDFSTLTIGQNNFSDGSIFGPTSFLSSTATGIKVFNISSTVDFDGLTARAQPTGETSLAQRVKEKHKQAVFQATLQSLHDGAYQDFGLSDKKFEEIATDFSEKSITADKDYSESAVNLQDSIDLYTIEVDGVISEYTPSLQGGNVVFYVKTESPELSALIDMPPIAEGHPHYEQLKAIYDKNAETNAAYFAARDKHIDNATKTKVDSAAAAQQTKRLQENPEERAAILETLQKDLKENPQLSDDRFKEWSEKLALEESVIKALIDNSELSKTAKPENKTALAQAKPPASKKVDNTSDQLLASAYTNDQIQNAQALLSEFTDNPITALCMILFSFMQEGGLEKFFGQFVNPDNKNGSSAIAHALTNTSLSKSDAMGILHRNMDKGKVAEYAVDISKNAERNAAQLRAAWAKTPEQVQNAIADASTKVGVDVSYLQLLAKAESSFDPLAAASTSSARGLYQFTKGTWLETIAKHGAKHGINTEGMSRKEILDLRFDAEKSALMAAEFARDNERYVESNYNGEVGDTERYFAHFLGPGGAVKFLNARAQNPSLNAATIFPAEAASNKRVFYEPSGEPRSLDEVYAHFYKKFSVTPGTSPKPNTIEVASASKPKTNIDAARGVEAEGLTSPDSSLADRSGGQLSQNFAQKADMPALPSNDITHQPNVTGPDHTKGIS